MVARVSKRSEISRKEISRWVIGHWDNRLQGNWSLGHWWPQNSYNFMFLSTYLQIEVTILLPFRPNMSNIFKVNIIIYEDILYHFYPVPLLNFILK